MASARLTGPITGGTHGCAMSASLLDLAAVGYVEEEYFLEGEAPTFALDDPEPRFDGRWDARVAGALPFKTRLLVRRPSDPARFNGTVLLVWSNVSMGCDMFTHDTAEVIEGGYAVVVVSAQAVGVHGFASAQPMGLTAWDPERYGSLVVSSDDASYGIYSIAASVVGPGRDRTSSVDPLDGLAVERIVATGASQSAARLHTYWNAVHPLDPIFDGFLIDVHFGWSTPLVSGTDGRSPDLAAVVAAFHPASLLRDDVDIPLLVVNTETEALTFYPVRRLDTHFFRFWEAAGASHASLPSMLEVLAKVRRDWGSALEMPPAGPVAPNPVSTAPLRDAGIHQMQRWLTTRVPPPSMPRIDIDGDPPQIQRDEHGIARGGIRLPQVDVPIAALRGSIDSVDRLAGLSGSAEPFSPETLRELYPSRDAYLDRVRTAIRNATEAGFLLERDAKVTWEEAEKVSFA